eukprot:TRINITY_DN61724_c0_g1_i2.p1 TRINITY_DN61724_c0_g1~~TRINITY_DN61724_c0_g1_i2.p1  ORF type:complete len:1032 (+),score=181.14 TRINITY_DN61724_c0_g1_i2:245-3340(+)
MCKPLSTCNYSLVGCRSTDEAREKNSGAAAAGSPVAGASPSSSLDVARLRKENHFLHDKLKDEETQMDHLRRLEEEKTRQVFHMETDLTATKEEHRRLRENAHALKEENKGLRAQLAEANLAVQQWKERALAADRDREALIRRADADRQQYTTSRVEMMQAKQLHSSSAHFSSSIQRVSIRERTPSPGGGRGADNTIELQRRVVQLANDLQAVTGENKRLQLTIEKGGGDNHALRNHIREMETEIKTLRSSLVVAENRVQAAETERTQHNIRMTHVETMLRQQVAEDGAKEIQRRIDDWEKERYILQTRIGQLEKDRAREREEFERVVSRHRAESALQLREQVIQVLEESAVKLTNVEKQEAARWQEQLERSKRTIYEKSERVRVLELELLREKERRIASEEESNKRLNKAKKDTNTLLQDLQQQLARERERRIKSDNKYQDQLHALQVGTEMKVRELDDLLRRERDFKGKTDAEHVDRLQRLANERDIAMTDARAFEEKLDKVMAEKIRSLEQAEDSINTLTDAITKERADRLRLERLVDDKMELLVEEQHEKARLSTQVKMLEEKVIQLLERQPLNTAGGGGRAATPGSPSSLNLVGQHHHTHTEHLQHTDHSSIVSSFVAVADPALVAEKEKYQGLAAAYHSKLAQAHELETSARERARKLMNYVHKERINAENEGAGGGGGGKLHITNAQQQQQLPTLATTTTTTTQNYSGVVPSGSGSTAATSTSGRSVSPTLVVSGPGGTAESAVYNGAAASHHHRSSSGTMFRPPLYSGGGGGAAPGGSGGRQQRLFPPRSVSATNIASSQASSLFFGSNNNHGSPFLGGSGGGRGASSLLSSTHVVGGGGGGGSRVGILHRSHSADSLVGPLSAYSDFSSAVEEAEREALKLRERASSAVTTATPPPTTTQLPTTTTLTTTSPTPTTTTSSSLMFGQAHQTPPPPANQQQEEEVHLTKEEEKELAPVATKIQSLFRGKQARKEAEEKRKEEQRKEKEEEEAAAVKIQQRFRGLRAKAKASPEKKTPSPEPVAF